MTRAEWILERLEELYEYIERFPESKLIPAIKSEIAYLESLSYLF